MASLFGGYELEAEIGRGGMGRVYRARHRATGVVRAIKTLEHAGDVESILRFKREAEALARVGGTIAVPIHESGSEGQRFFFVMDLMPGGSLDDRLRRGPRLPWRESVALVATLASHVAVLHDHGLVHRDLKPANVLFGDDGAPRLADLGCVRELASVSLTASGTILGTLAYMAPEQLEGDRVDRPADVFALGAILHELVSGAPLYQGGVREQLERRHALGVRARLAGPVGDIPAELDALVDQALAPSPELRPTAHAFARSLRALLGPTRTKVTKSVKEEPRLRVPVLAGALGLALLTIAGAWLRARTTSTPPRATPSTWATPTSTPSPSPPPGVATPVDAIHHANALLKDPAPITSATEPLRELESLVHAGRGDLVSALAGRGLTYAPRDLEGTGLSDPPAAARAALATLWINSALASRDPELRARATGRLEATPGNALIVEAIRCIDEIAWVLAEGDDAGRVPPTHLGNMELVVAKLPPPAVAGVLAPLEPFYRAGALDAIGCSFSDRSTPARVSQYLWPLLEREVPHLSPVLRFLVLVLSPGALRKQIGREVMPQFQMHAPWTSEHGDDLDDGNLRLLARRRRFYSDEFEKLAKELAASDPVVSVAARVIGLSTLIWAERDDGQFDARLVERCERALEEVAALGADTELRRALEHSVRRALAQHLQNAAMRESDAAARAPLYTRAATEASAAFALLPPAPRDNKDSDVRFNDIHAMCLTLLACGVSPDDSRIRALESQLRTIDWLHAALAWRRHDPGAVLDYVKGLENMRDQQPPPPSYWTGDYVTSLAVRVLARIERGEVEKAAVDYESISTVAPAIFALPEIELPALKAALDKARRR